METRKRDDDLEELEFDGYKVVLDSDKKEENQPKYYVDKEVLEEIEKSTSEPQKIEEPIEEEITESEEPKEVSEEVVDEINSQDEVKKDKPFYKTVSFYIITAIMLCVIVFNILFCFAFVNGESMYPTLNDGQFLFARRSNSNLNRFDIVIIETEDINLIKRVIGMPNEKVEYKDQKLYINGQEVEDNYGNGKTEDFSVTLGENEYYCLGDNRENSADSRVYGAFNLDIIYAKILK